MISVNEQSDLALELEQIDPELYSTLYPYQLACIAEMDKLERENKIDMITQNEIIGKVYTHYGILANPVGTGKTLIALGLVSLFNKFRKPVDESVLIKQTHFTGDKLYITRYGLRSQFFEEGRHIIEFTFAKCTVIVIPDTLEKQWITELEKTKLSFVTVNGKFLDSNFTFDGKSVVLCKAGFYARFAKACKAVIFNRLIVDETDTITKSKFKLLISDFTWFISGTPHGLENERMDGIFEYTKRLDFDTINLLSVKCDDSFIKKVNCPVNKHIVRCKVSRALSSIRSYVTQEVWDRINADDTESAMQLLGGTVFSVPIFIERITSTMNFEIVNNSNEMTTISQNGLLTPQQQQEKISALEKKNRSLQARLTAIKEAVTAVTSEAAVCPVCMEDTDSPVITDCCKNLYCIRCITTLSGQRCPTCRLALDLEKMCLISERKVSQKESADISVPVLKEKKQELKDLITRIDSSGVNKKILIFSDFIGTFDTINTVLEETGVSFVKAMTKNSRLNRKLEEYNKATETKVLLMLSEEHARGLNLEKTTDIIIYHTVNVNTETQIIGRAMRLSRDQGLELNVWYLVNENEQA